MTPLELARKATVMVRARPVLTPGLVSSWSACMLDAVYSADEFANSEAMRVVVDRLSRRLPVRPHRWTYHTEAVRAEVTHDLECVVLQFEAEQ